MKGENVDDILVRDAADGPRAFHPRGGGPVTPDSRSTIVGMGGNGFATLN